MPKKRDLVERLRDYDTCSDADVDEAADEIVRLREEIKTLKKQTPKNKRTKVDAEQAYVESISGEWA